MGRSASLPGRRDFSAATHRALAARGVFVLSSVAVPADASDRYFSAVAYRLDVNGTGCVRSFSEVLALAEGRA